MEWQGPRKPKTDFDNSSLRSYLSPLVFIVRSGPMWRQDLARSCLQKGPATTPANYVCGIQSPETCFRDRVLQESLKFQRSSVGPSTDWTLYHLCFTPSTALGPFAIGGAIGRPYLSIHTQVGVFNHLVLNHLAQPCDGGAIVSKTLGQKSCRTKVTRSFWIFVPILPRILLRIFPEFLEEISCFVFLGKRRPEKINQKSLPFFNANSQANSKKKSTKVCWRAGKVT